MSDKGILNHDSKNQTDLNFQFQLFDLNFLWFSIDFHFNFDFDFDFLISFFFYDFSLIITIVNSSVLEAIVRSSEPDLCKDEKKKMKKMDEGGQKIFRK